MLTRPQQALRAPAAAQAHGGSAAASGPSGFSSPLSGLLEADGRALERGEDRAAKLSEIRGLRLVNLRVDPGDAAAAGAVRGVLGFGLPDAPNTIAQGQGLAALWLAPQEWLLRGAGSGGADLAPRLESALSDRFFAVNELSDAFAVMRLQGPQSRAALSAGCPLDLHPRVFKRDQCAQSHFFKSSILLWALADDGNAWEITVRRSFSDYVARMLLDAMTDVA